MKLLHGGWRKVSQQGGRSVAEWDSSRRSCTTQTSALETNEARARKTVLAQHWLTLVCYVEAIDPKELRLEPVREKQVELGLAQLALFDPLDIYALALERISHPDSTFSAQTQERDSESI